MVVDAGMAETEPGTPPRRARIRNTGEEGRRYPAMRRSHLLHGDEFPARHLPPRSLRVARLGLPALLGLFRLLGGRRRRTRVVAECVLASRERLPLRPDRR